MKGDIGLLRERGGGTQVTLFELFFDLVYVFAITQLSHRLIDHLTIGGALETLLLLLAVWWAWMYTSWTTNWFDPGHPAIRLMLAAVMLASLVMSAFLPDAFGDWGLWFAGAYVAIQVGRPAFLVVVLKGHELAVTFRGILAWHSFSGALWLLGGAFHGNVRVALWLVALILEFAAPWHGYAVPGLGRSRTSEWKIEGGHMAERCQLFMIIALGESIVVTGATATDMGPSAGTLAALAVAFAGTVALWWIYFDRVAEAAAEAIAASDDPARLGRSAYTFIHIPLVAGIIVTAVGDELVIAHPGGHVPGGTAAVLLGGPALYLAGHVLFTRVVFGTLSRGRPAAIAALAALIPVSFVTTPLALAALATLVLVALAAADVRARRAAGSAAPIC